MPFNLQSNSALPHLGRRRVFMFVLNRREAVHLQRAKRKATKTLFMWLHCPHLKQFHPVLFPHTAYTTLTSRSKPPPAFPNVWEMTNSYWGHSWNKHRCKVLCFIPLACAIHMAGSEQNTHCSRPSLLFEACSKGARADLTWRHLLNKRVCTVPLGERKGEKQSFWGPVKAKHTKTEEWCWQDTHTVV